MWLDDTKGENNRRAKLTRSQAETLVMLRRRGWSVAALAKRFSLSADHVRKICRGVKWKSIA